MLALGVLFNFAINLGNKQIDGNSNTSAKWVVGKKN
jgi:hypothetical protein